MLDFRFKIDHIDPLGQGVSKENSVITFVTKTLPGEEGFAKILKKNKNVQFANLEILEHLTQKSPDRIPYECPHFLQCPSCHFLHAPYAFEIDHKEKVLLRLLADLKKKRPHLLSILSESLNKMRIRPAPQRFFYRKRVQLHYDLHEGKLGYIHPLLNDIIEVPQCLLPKSEIGSVIQKLYQSEDGEDRPRWKNLAMKNCDGRMRGHVEISIEVGSQRERGPEMHWNAPYSSGGFTQVNEEMNQVMVDEIQSLSLKISSENEVILDLFGGNGNLSQGLIKHKVIVVDNFPSELPHKPHHQTFYQCNLYGKNAPTLIKKKLQETGKELALLMLDPPRTGVKNFSEFLARLRPQLVFYVSCNPQTLFRDLSNIQCDEYAIEEIVLIDMFPSTFHFETLVSLKRI